MLAYIVRRLGALVVILLGSSFILYNMAAISADPLESLRVSTDPNAKQLMIALSRELNLDVPPPLRYFIWLEGVLGGFVGDFDLGMTREAQPVLSALTTAIPTTIRLVFGATIIAIVLGISLGIISALRQYSRFDYSMTFVAFLLFSLPIFWVAVLLKQYMAIQFNDFLTNPNIAIPWLIGISAFVGLFWAALISGTRQRVAVIFIVASAATGSMIFFLNTINWFSNPGLGPITLLLLNIGVAFGITQLSTGVSNRSALYASLAMAFAGFISYFPMQAVFDGDSRRIKVFIAFVIMILVSIAASLIFAKVDRGPVIRTSLLTSFLIALLIFLDKFMKTWAPYMATDAINNRPIPTIGQRNTLLEFEDTTWWIDTLDILVHMFLPTIALTLISFAGYIRYARGTLLEVLNQDYIRTARAKGLTERTVIMRHAFRNTMIPLTTIMVVDFAGIIGGAIITERVFGWTGMGTLFNRAITQFDLNLLMGVFIVTGFLAVFANLVADLLYSALDPRIRVGSGK
ncbi:MAG: ABC transporter permease [Candidatus Nanopelagicales bacterium]